MSASPAEVKLVAQPVADVTEKLAGSKTYHCDRLDAQVLEFEGFGTEISRHTPRDTELTTNALWSAIVAIQTTLEGGALVGWLYNFHRLVVPYDYEWTTYKLLLL